MKTIIIILMISFHGGELGAGVEVMKDMETCKREEVRLAEKYDSLSFFACLTITKEELENPKSATSR